MVQEFKAHCHVVTCVAFSPVDPRALATSSWDKVVCIWALSEDRQEAKRRHKLTGHICWVHSIAWSRDGSFLVSGSDDKTIRKWNASTGECELVIKTPYSVYTVAYSPDGRHLISEGYHDSLYIWDASTGNRILGPLTKYANFFSTVAYTPNGWHHVSSSRDNISVESPKSNSELMHPLTVGSDRTSPHYLHPSKGTFGADPSDETITTWDENRLRPVQEKFCAHGGPATSVQYSPDGRVAMSVSMDEMLSMWDTKNDREVIVPAKHGSGVWAAAFSPDGRCVASGDFDGFVKIWELRWFVGS